MTPKQQEIFKRDVDCLKLAALHFTEPCDETYDEIAEQLGVARKVLGDVVAAAIELGWIETCKIGKRTVREWVGKKPKDLTDEELESFEGTRIKISYHNNDSSLTRAEILASLWPLTLEELTATMAHNDDATVVKAYRNRALNQ